MALRTRTAATAIAVAGTTIAHGCTGTPTEISVLPTVAAGAGQTYRYAATDATNVYLAQGTSATTADIVCGVNHSIIQ